MKQHKIFTGVFQLKMACLANQIVAVCAYLPNFYPVLVPPHTLTTHDNVGSNDNDLDLDNQSDSDIS